MNNEENRFIDPLDELINKHKQAAGSVNKETTELPEIKDEDIIIPTEAEENDNDTADINYGDSDLLDEIHQAEIAEEERRQAIAEERRKANEEEQKKVAGPPPVSAVEYEKYVTEAVDFQTDKLNIVTGMVNEVIKKHHLVGGIPESTEDIPDLRNKVMGELVDIYHKTGDVITPEFENMILEYWVSADETDTTQHEEDIKKESVKEQKPEEVAPTINVTVQPNTPVNIHIDEEVTTKLNMNSKREININVIEVDERELASSVKLVKNSQAEGIISAYDSGLTDVPITLPFSAYRCVMRGINWSDFIQLAAPSSDNSSDAERKKWSVIYKHIKNTSIGDFTDFEDFLKKTKYYDRELMMWALLVATSNEEEPLSLRCQNPKCKMPINIKYRPREIVHLDEELIPKYYLKTHEAAVGDEARAHFNKTNMTSKRYKLPNTGVIVETEEVSAYDFINTKLPLVQQLYKEYHPSGNLAEFDSEDPRMAEFEYLSAHAIYVTSMSIIKDDIEYRYTNWDDIKKIITEMLDAEDSGILFKLIEQLRSKGAPVSFYIDGYECPHCHRKESKLPITDIGQTLLFQVSRRLGNTTINLIETD